MIIAPGVHIRGSYHLEGKQLFGPLDLWLPMGQWTCVLGRSGVGKSTLLRQIAGLAGAGRFDGEIRADDNAPLDGRVSFMAQSDLLLPWLSVLDNVVIGARLRGERPDRDRARAMLARVGLERQTLHRPAMLSGGMRQRAALARTLVEDRPVALLDEPFSALDAGTRADMQELAAEVLRGRTVVLVTHDPVEAVRLGHHVVLMTPDGARSWGLPTSAPLRDPTAPETVDCQARLLDRLRGRQ